MTLLVGVKQATTMHSKTIVPIKTTHLFLFCNSFLEMCSLVHSQMIFVEAFMTKLFVTSEDQKQPLRYQVILLINAMEYEELNQKRKYPFMHTYEKTAKICVNQKMLRKVSRAAFGLQVRCPHPLSECLHSTLSSSFLLTQTLTGSAKSMPSTWHTWMQLLALSFSPGPVLAAAGRGGWELCICVCICACLSNAATNYIIKYLL